MDYSRYYKEAEEILKHHRAEDNSPECQEEYKKVFLTSTTISPADLKKIVAWYSDTKRTEDITNAEVALLLVLFAGLKLHEAATLEFGDVAVYGDLEEEDPIPVITIENTENKRRNRAVPIPRFLFFMLMDGRKRVGDNKYVIGEGDEPVDVNKLSEEFFALLEKIGVIHDEQFVAMAVNLEIEKEEKGKKAIKEDDLAEYLCRRTFATYCAVNNLTAEQIEYLLGVRVRKEVITINMTGLTEVFESMTGGWQFGTFFGGEDR